MIPTPTVKLVKKTSSPRASGDDPRKTLLLSIVIKVVPARAGMIPDTTFTIYNSMSSPRASGDDPLEQQQDLKTAV